MGTDARILIMDDASFTRVCSAILEAEGFQTDSTCPGLHDTEPVDLRGVSLIITSYPCGRSVLERLGADVPIIVLTDIINVELLSILRGVERSYCMVKPINYPRFKTLVRGIVEGQVASQGGLNIV